MMNKKTMMLSALIVGAVCVAALFSRKTALNQEAVSTTDINVEGSSKTLETTPFDLTWDKPGKEPEQYSWEEYQELSYEDQEKFYQWFDSEEMFEEWMETVNLEETTLFSLEWDKTGKEPDQYSWDEYQELSYEDQEKFYQWFDSEEAFEKWVTDAESEETTVDMEKWSNTEKKPNEYTWDEYQALDGAEREAFYQWFDSADDFNKWVNTVRPVQNISVVTQWNDTEKKPSEYTWEEYQNLSGEEQEKFYQWFDSLNAFEEWMISVKSEESDVSVEKWNKTGKQPDEYSWKEYQKLSNEDQESFYQWFGSEEAFETWMTSVKSEENMVEVEAWEKSGKQPDKYSWEEYQKLSDADKESFYQWFDSVEKFEAWMTSAKEGETFAVAEKWNKSGKQPDAYTWEEYQALSPQEQDLFFQWFESVEAFETWMDYWQNDSEEEITESEETESKGM